MSGATGSAVAVTVGEAVAMPIVVIVLVVVVSGDVQLGGPQALRVSSRSRMTTAERARPVSCVQLTGMEQ
jgi:hypothetical protein